MGRWSAGGLWSFWCGGSRHRPSPLRIFDNWRTGIDALHGCHKPVSLIDRCVHPRGGYPLNGPKARAADVASVGVAWGYHPTDELSAAGAGAIAQAFADVPDAVKLLLSG